jgi:histidine ammonia-lyase
MGSISGRKALQVLGNVEKILAIELLTAAQAFEFRKPMKSGVLLEEVHKAIRKRVPFADKDRVFALDMEIGIEMVADGTIITTVDNMCKKAKVSLDTPYSNAFEIY